VVVNPSPSYRPPSVAAGIDMSRRRVDVLTSLDSGDDDAEDVKKEFHRLHDAERADTKLDMKGGRPRGTLVDVEGMVVNASKVRAPPPAPPPGGSRQPVGGCRSENRNAWGCSGKC